MKTVRVANYFGTTGELQLLNQTIIWPGGTTTIPIGRPACGFDNEFCEVKAKGMESMQYYWHKQPTVFLFKIVYHDYIFYKLNAGPLWGYFEFVIR